MIVTELFFFSLCASICAIYFCWTWLFPYNCGQLVPATCSKIFSPLNVNSVAGVQFRMCTLRWWRVLFFFILNWNDSPLNDFNLTSKSVRIDYLSRPPHFTRTSAKTQLYLIINIVAFGQVKTFLSWFDLLNVCTTAQHANFFFHSVTLLLRLTEPVCLLS